MKKLTDAEIWGLRNIIERAIYKEDNVKRVIKDYSIHYKVTQKYIRSLVKDLITPKNKEEK